MIEEQKDIEYVIVDIDALSASLAEEMWSQETKMIPKDDLYEATVNNVSGENIPRIGRQVKPFWANLFFSIKQNYEKLIRSHVKE